MNFLKFKILSLKFSSLDSEKLLKLCYKGEAQIGDQYQLLAGTSHNTNIPYTTCTLTQG